MQIEFILEISSFKIVFNSLYYAWRSSEIYFASKAVNNPWKSVFKLLHYALILSEWFLPEKYLSSTSAITIGWLAKVRYSNWWSLQLSDCVYVKTSSRLRPMVAVNDNASYQIWYSIGGKTAGWFFVIDFVVADEFPCVCRMRGRQNTDVGFVGGLWWIKRILVKAYEWEQHFSCLQNARTLANSMKDWLGRVGDSDERRPRMHAQHTRTDTPHIHHRVAYTQRTRIWYMQDIRAPWSVGRFAVKCLNQQ